MKGLMRVGMYHGNRNVWVEEVPIPEISDNEILLKVMASGICGSDLMESHRKKDKPYVLGHEISGKIVEVGKNVNKYKVGDRIFVTHHVPCDSCRTCLRGYKTNCDKFKKINNFVPGGFAEYVKVGGRSLETGAIKLPDEMSYEQASFIEPLGTVVESLKKTDNGFNGDDILILGAGVGLLHMQVARAYGAGRIIVADINKYRLKKALELGADNVINTKDLHNLNNLREINEGKLADRVIIATGAKEATEKAFESYGPGSNILFFATPSKKDKVWSDFYEYWRDVSTIGMTYGATPQSNYTAYWLIRHGVVNVNEMITHRLPLEDIAEGFRIASEGKDCLKVIIKPHGDLE